MTARIHEFLRNRREDGPCVVVDLEVIQKNYQRFARALPDTRVFYAVKANPAPEILRLLTRMGSCFDTASVQEMEMVLAAGATADRISYGNTIKKERDIARAFEMGVELFAVDCVAEVEKIRRSSRAADAGPWVNHWGEMARKTVIKRLAKRLPSSADLDQVIASDNEAVGLAPEAAGSPRIDPVPAPAPVALPAEEAPTSRLRRSMRGRTRRADLVEAEAATQQAQPEPAPQPQPEQEVTDAAAEDAAPDAHF